MKVIRIIAIADGRPFPDSPEIAERFVRSMDVEALGGRGSLQWTSMRSRAMRFENVAAATNYWMRQSKTVPLRDDGKPNRPLTAYTISIEDHHGSPA